MIGYTSLAVGSSSSTVPLSIAFLLFCQPFHFQLHCSEKGTNLCLRLLFLLTIMLIYLSVCSSTSYLVRLFPEFMLHAIRIAISSDE